MRSMISRSKQSLRIITKKEIENNKIISSLLILSIFLSTVLLTITFLISDQMKDMNIKVSGTWTGLYQNIDPNLFSTIDQEEEVKLAGLSINIGSTSINDYIINVSYADKDALVLSGLDIRSGRMPSDKNEILVEESLRGQSGRKIITGDKIYLKLPTDTSSSNEFIVCGTFAAPSSEMDKKTFGAIVSKEYLNSIDNHFLQTNIFVQLNTTNKSLAKEQLNYILEKNQAVANYALNEAYLTSLENAWIYTALGAGLGIVILILAYFTVYCISYISIINNVKKYGQLRTIGVTFKQIRYINRWKYTIFLVNGLALGSILGGVIAFIVIPDTFSLTNLVRKFIVIVIIEALMVALAARKPLNIIKTMSLVDSSRYIGVEDIKPHKTINHITPFSLAKLYNRRYRKKVNLTVLLLALSGSLVIICSTILSSLDAKKMSKQNFLNEDYHISIEDDLLRANAMEKVQINNPLNSQLISELKGLSNVKEIWSKLDLPFFLDMKEKESISSIVSFDAGEYNRIKEIIVEGELPLYNELNRSDIIIGRPSDFKEITGYAPKVNSTIKLGIFKGNIREEIELRIIAILDEKKAIQNKFDTFIMSYKCMNELSEANLTSEIYIQSDGTVEADNQILNVVDKYENIQVDSLNGVTEKMKCFYILLKL